MTLHQMLPKYKMPKAKFDVNCSFFPNRVAKWISRFLFFDIQFTDYFLQIFVFSIQLTENKNCRCRDLNDQSLEQEATTFLLNEPQPSPCHSTLFSIMQSFSAHPLHQYVRFIILSRQARIIFCNFKLKIQLDQ